MSVLCYSSLPEFNVSHLDNFTPCHALQREGKKDMQTLISKTHGCLAKTIASGSQPSN